MAILISKNTFTVKGVVENTSGSRLKGFTIKAYDKDLIGKDDDLGKAYTDSNGQFSISFNRSDFTGLFLLDKHPDLYFEVYSGTTLLKSTKDNVLRNAKASSAPIVLQVSIAEDDSNTIPENFEGEVHWEMIQGVAQYKNADWSKEVKRVSNVSNYEAKKIASEDPNITFFFHCVSPVVLEGKGTFKADDAVFFSGEPRYGSCPQANSYVKRLVAWEKKPNSAEYKGADWKHHIHRLHSVTLEAAKKFAREHPEVTYFFYCREHLYLEGKSGPGGWSEKGIFKPGDAVFFSGKPWLSSAPQSDAYVKVERKLA